MDFSHAVERCLSKLWILVRNVSASMHSTVKQSLVYFFDRKTRFVKVYRKFLKVGRFENRHLYALKFRQQLNREISIGYYGFSELSEAFRAQKGHVNGGGKGAESLIRADV